MSTTVPVEVDAVIDECVDWLARHGGDDVTLRGWWGLLADAGWSFPSWPVGLGGRALPSEATRAIRRVMEARNVVGPPHSIGVTMLAPTLLRHGTSDQIRRYVGPIARGELAACQLFSEPGAGSDLAGLRTRAVRGGDRWTVDGQKVWNSEAHVADVGMLLARTQPELPKHQGITYFVLDMHQDGIVVRPLRQMNGLAEFNEVFIDAAQVSDGEVVGEIHKGWGVAQTTLALERSATPPRLLTPPAGERSGWLDLEVGEVRRRLAQATKPRPYPRSGRAASRLAVARGQNLDPVLRDRITQLHILSEISKWTLQRGGAVRGLAQVAKLQAAELARRARDVDLDVLGADGMLGGSDATDGGTVMLMALSAHVVSIGGGTDEIQKNVLGERVLELPREPDASVSVPFQDLPT
jgi:alkylation response protein AidB-like acyl-CoA dehydrogenase